MTPASQPPALVDDKLTVEERSCLLRAARRRLRTLQAEVHRLEMLPSVHAQAAIEATQTELDCLVRSVSWLWRQH